MTRMILRLDSKRRLTLPVSLLPWKPGDYIEVTYVGSEDAFAASRVEPGVNPLKVLKKASGEDSKKSRKKAKKNK